MDIITRNFLRLLKCGVFGIMEQLEPMSNFKWLKLIQLSITQECMGITYDGMVRYVNARQMTLASKVNDEWVSVITKTEADAREMNNSIAELYQIFSREPRLFYPVLLRGRGMAQLYSNPLHYYCDHIDWYIPTEEKAREADAWAKRETKILSDIDPNKLKYKFNEVKVENNHFVQELMDRKLNKDLQVLVTREKSYYKPNYIEVNSVKVEILPPSINLLMLILHLMTHILEEDVKPQMIIDLGMFLRKLGHLVDYIKIERWLNELGMQKIANLEGSLLISLFNFTQDEIPFMTEYLEEDVTGLIANIFSNEYMNPTDEFSISKRTKKNFKHLYRSATTFRYHPREITGSYVSKITRQFSRIEE
ncbi:MAG: nucleotidyltransferase family protein [Prevotellaceae bacterium]|nr:nucleotidyltransferase family protein [Prevotellaceae bacterium]